MAQKNDDKFDSPKRKSGSDSDSSDSDSSDSDSSSDSDTEDSDSDSGSDDDATKTATTAKLEKTNIPGKVSYIVGISVRSFFFENKYIPENLFFFVYCKSEFR